jgi:hypothetical protein
VEPPVVLERLVGEEPARCQVLLEDPHDLAAHVAADLVAALVDGGRRARAGEGHPDRLGDAGHRVRGVLAAAAARGRTRVALHFEEIRVAHLPRAVGADRLVDVHDRHVAAVVAAGEDGASVEEEAGDVEAGHRHEHAGEALVATGEADERVVAVRADHELDRVGDHLAGDERGLHALVAHGDAVAHRDGDELPRGTACLVDARLHRLGLRVEGEVAGGRFVPAARDPHPRTVDLRVAEAHRAEERPLRRPLGTLGDDAAADAFHRSAPRWDGGAE